MASASEFTATTGVQDQNDDSPKFTRKRSAEPMEEGEGEPTSKRAKLPHIPWGATPIEVAENVAAMNVAGAPKLLLTSMPYAEEVQMLAREALQHPGKDQAIHFCNRTNGDKNAATKEMLGTAVEWDMDMHVKAPNRHSAHKLPFVSKVRIAGLLPKIRELVGDPDFMRMAPGTKRDVYGAAIRTEEHWRFRELAKSDDFVPVDGMPDYRVRGIPGRILDCLSCIVGTVADPTHEGCVANDVKGLLNVYVDGPTEDHKDLYSHRLKVAEDVVAATDNLFEGGYAGVEANMDKIIEEIAGGLEKMASDPDSVFATPEVAPLVPDPQLPNLDYVDQWLSYATGPMKAFLDHMVAAGDWGTAARLDDGCTVVTPEEARAVATQKVLSRTATVWSNELEELPASQRAMIEREALRAHWEKISRVVPKYAETLLCYFPGCHFDWIYELVAYMAAAASATPEEFHRGMSADEHVPAFADVAKLQPGALQTIFKSGRVFGDAFVLSAMDLEVDDARAQELKEPLVPEGRLATVACTADPRSTRADGRAFDERPGDTILALRAAEESGQPCDVAATPLPKLAAWLLERHAKGVLAGAMLCDPNVVKNSGAAAKSFL